MKYFVIFIVLFCVGAVFYMLRNGINVKDSCIVKNGGIEWYLERADSHTEREIGLMNREKMCDNCGMIFIFPEKQQLSFWMKNTLIPLDMYFYDERGKLVDMVKNMRPEKETGEPMQYTSLPARYVIETNAGSHWTESIEGMTNCINTQNQF